MNLEKNLREALIEIEEKASPRRVTLTKEEQTHIAKLTDIVARLRRGENVQTRQLQTWLSADDYAMIDAEWQEQLALRNELKDKPIALKRYDEKLNKAQMMRNRADAYHCKGREVLAKKMAKPETKTVTRTVAIPKTKIVTQQPQQQTTPKDAEPTDFTPIRPQPPLPNKQDDRDKR
jgi:ABC-type sulfate/molybdate transport systems ATPase subunit